MSDCTIQNNEWEYNDDLAAQATFIDNLGFSSHCKQGSKQKLRPLLDTWYGLEKGAGHPICIIIGLDDPRTCTEHDDRCNMRKDSDGPYSVLFRHEAVFFSCWG